MDEDQKRHLDRIICPYEAVSSSLVSGQMRYLGIERQPATPLPNRKGDETFFPKPGNMSHKPFVHRPNKTHPVGDITYGGHSARKKLHPGPADTLTGSVTSGRTSNSVVSKPAPSVESKPKLPKSSTGSSQSQQASASASGSSSKSNGPTSNYSTPGSQQADHRNDPGAIPAGANSSSSSSGGNRKKQVSTVASAEPSSQSVKQPIKIEPLLQSFNKEFTTFTNPPSSITNKNNKAVTIVSKGSEKSDSKSHSDPLSVIKDNRNGAVYNGGSKLNRPRLHIPEVSCVSFYINFSLPIRHHWFYIGRHGYNRRPHTY